MKPGPAFMIAVDERIKESGMQQNRIAEEVGLAPSTFSSYKTGRAYMPISTMRRIMIVLDMPVEETFIKAFGWDNCMAMNVIDSDTSKPEHARTPIGLAYVLHELYWHVATGLKEDFREAMNTLDRLHAISPRYTQFKVDLGMMIGRVKSEEEESE